MFVRVLTEGRASYSLTFTIKELKHTFGSANTLFGSQLGCIGTHVQGFPSSRFLLSASAHDDLCMPRTSSCGSLVFALVSSSWDDMSSTWFSLSRGLSSMACRGLLRPDSNTPMS